MKKILIAFLLAVLPVFGFAQTSGNPTKVYISTSTMAKAYHKTKNCISLKNDQDKLKYVTLEYAKNLGRTPCKNCFGEMVSNPSNVFVCTGGSSKKYHGLKDCRGLSSCNGSVVKMTVAKAKQAGRTACKLCIKQ